MCLHKCQNLFVHFEPLGHALLHHEERGDEARDDDEESLEQLYQRAWKKLKTKCVDDDECRARVDLNVVANTRVPHYILPGSEEEGRWLQTHTKARLVRFLEWHIFLLDQNIAEDSIAHHGCSTIFSLSCHPSSIAGHYDWRQRLYDKGYDCPHCRIER